MPLFSHKEPAPEPAHERKGSIFNRNRSPTSETPASPTSGSHGLFGRRTHSDDSDTNSRIHKDPSIQAARQKVNDAEAAEKAADKALLQARAAVKEVRDHLKNLEKEVAEE